MALRGYLEIATRERIVGWAQDTNAPDVPVALVVTANDEVVSRVLATRYRADLERASIGDGRFGFELDLTGCLSPLTRYLISVRREHDGAHLQRSPVALEPASAFDRTMEESIERVLSAVVDEADFERRRFFLSGLMQSLSQRHANWAHHSHSPGVQAVSDEEDHPALRALVIDDTSPRAERDAGSSALLSHIKSLQRLGYAVSFAAADLGGASADLETMGVRCCSKPWYSCVEDVLQRHATGFDLVYLHRLSNAARYGALVRHHQPKARLLYSVADLLSLRLARQAVVQQRKELLAHSRQSGTMEWMAAWYADAVITHSTVEAQLLQRQHPQAKIHVVPWAVPPRPTRVPFSERKGVAFIGHYRHQPNLDAARWLAEKIWPEFEKREADVSCLIAGSDMPQELHRFAGRTIEVLGSVPDLAEIFDKVRLTVAPLAFGAGIKGKVLASLAAGIPCVCTPVAAEGLPFPPLLLQNVGNTPAELAAKMHRLHADQSFNEDCAAAGLAFVDQFAGEAKVDGLMRDAIAHVLPPA